MEKRFPRRIALAERSVAFRRTHFRGSMSRARPAHRPFAVAAALVLATLITIPVQAASPHPNTPTLRRGGHAWDKPAVDDPSRLIVTFRPGTTTADRTRAIKGTGARQTTKMPRSRTMAVKAPAGHAH